MGLTQSERMKAYRAANPEKCKAAVDQYRASKATWLREKRRAMRKRISELKNVPCQDCGNRFPSCVMDFDHRNPSEKSFEISNVMTRSWDGILEEVAKCDIVCANCHRIRTHVWEKV